MRQAADYWFGQDSRHWVLVAYDEAGKSYIVKVQKRDNEMVEHAEHRLITRMHKLYRLATAY